MHRLSARVDNEKIRNKGAEHWPHKDHLSNSMSTGSRKSQMQEIHYIDVNER